MNKNNRIDVIRNLPSETARADAYFSLDLRIATKVEGKLSEEEAQSAANALPQEPSVQARTFLWRLLINAPPQGVVRYLALRGLRDPHDKNRGLAFLYLRVHHPELMPQLAAQYRNDPDCDVRYEITELVRASDLDKAIDMKIDLLPTESHELSDALTIEISELGKQRHLQELRRRDALAGGGTDFGRIADLLANKLNAQ